MVLIALYFFKAAENQLSAIPYHNLTVCDIPMHLCGKGIENYAFTMSDNECAF